MSATISVVTPEEFAAFKQELVLVKQELAVVRAFVTDNDEWLTTDQAVRKAGVKNRDILEKYARASRPNTNEPGRITWRKQGAKCQYRNTSCFNYAQRKLGQPGLMALAA
jgi:hypothetical protein